MRFEERKGYESLLAFQKGLEGLMIGQTRLWTIGRYGMAVVLVDRTIPRCDGRFQRVLSTPA